MQKYLLSTTVSTAYETWITMKQVGLTEAVTGTLEFRVEVVGIVLTLTCPFKLIHHGKIFKRADVYKDYWDYPVDSYTCYVKLDPDNIQNQLKIFDLDISTEEIISLIQEDADFHSIVYQHAKTAHLFDDYLGITNSLTLEELKQAPFTFIKCLGIERLEEDAKHLDCVRFPDIAKYIPCECVSLDETLKVNMYTFDDGSVIISDVANRFTPEEYFKKHIQKFHSARTAFEKDVTAKSRMLSSRKRVADFLEASPFELISKYVICSPKSVQTLSNEIEDHLSESGIKILSGETRDRFNLAINDGRRTVFLKGEVECW